MLITQHKNLGLFVVYNLPNRDCSALASNGELTVKDDGAAKYKKYIDSIAAQLTEHKDSKVALVIGENLPSPTS